MVPAMMRIRSDHATCCVILRLCWIRCSENSIGPSREWNAHKRRTEREPQSCRPREAGYVLRSRALSRAWMVGTGAGAESLPTMRLRPARGLPSSHSMRPRLPARASRGRLFRCRKNRHTRLPARASRDRTRGLSPIRVVTSERMPQTPERNRRTARYPATRERPAPPTNWTRKLEPAELCRSHQSWNRSNRKFVTISTRGVGREQRPNAAIAGPSASAASAKFPSRSKASGLLLRDGRDCSSLNPARSGRVGHHYRRRHRSLDGNQPPVCATVENTWADRSADGPILCPRPADTARRRNSDRR